MTEDFIFGTTKFSEEVVRKKQAQFSTVWHGHRIHPRDPRPDQPVEIIVDVGIKHRADAVYCYWTTGDDLPVGREGEASLGQVLSLDAVGPVWQDLAWGYVQRWKGILPLQTDGTLVRYRIEAWDEHKQTSAFADSGTEDPSNEAPFAYHVDRWTAPDWIRDSVIYQIMVDRFYPGDGREWNDAPIRRGVLGGTLRGVLEKLPYITNLGVNALWISPITESPSWHGYNTSDHRAVASKFGTNEDFRELVRAAHNLGIRIILDFVPHSTSHDHPYLQEAQRDRESPYVKWYTFKDWPDEYDCFFGVKTMPHLNLENPPTRQYILDAARMWMTDYEVDGYRLDYAVKPSHDFWVDFRRSLRQAKGDCLTLAESVASPEELITYEGKMDGCLDFLLVEQIRAVFAYGSINLSMLERALSLHDAYFDSDFIRPSFIDNHDMNRFIHIVQGDIRRIKLAAIFQFTLSQPPIVLYGTEIGLQQQKDSSEDLDYVREPMHWDETKENELLDFYRCLIQIRKDRECLRRGTRRTLYVDAETLIYAKEGAENTSIIAINRESKDKRVVLQIGEERRAFKDLLSDIEIFVDDGKLELSLQPWQGQILMPVS
jgi:cyclomaltodextrinase